MNNFIGQRVRWGGTVVRVENRAQESVIEVVNRELDASARPIRLDRSGGRFMAVIRGFIDPVIYEAGRDITVIGTLEKIVSAPLGDFSYQYPLLQVESHKLWEKHLPRPYRRDPYGYDPWYPWHPGYAPWWY